MLRYRIIAAVCLVVLLVSCIAQPTLSKYVLRDLGTILTSVVNGHVYTVTYYDASGNVFHRHTEYSNQPHTLLALQGAATDTSLQFRLSDGTTKAMELPENAVRFLCWETVTGTEASAQITNSLALRPRFEYFQSATATFTVTYMDMTGTSIVATRTFDNSKTGDVYHYIGKTPGEAGVLFPSTTTDPTTGALRPDLDPLYQDSLSLAAHNMTFSHWEVRTRIDDNNTEITLWDEYVLTEQDVVVYPTYVYTGIIGLEGYDQNQDGAIDYFEVVPVTELPDEVFIPGNVNGVPVKNIDKLFTGGYADNVKSIHIGEGVETIGENGLAATPNLATTYLPSTLTSIGDHIFSQNPGKDTKELHIIFAGTMEQWDQISKISTWDAGLEEGTLLQCADGYMVVTKQKGNDSTWGSWIAGDPPANVIPDNSTAS